MRLIRACLALVLLVAIVSVAYAVVADLGWLDPETIPTQIPSDVDQANVEWVYDGDTISVLMPDGALETVRLTGIDAPETGANFTTPQCFGAESTEHLRGLLPVGSNVWLERDVSERDRYGRLARFVWIAEEDQGVLVNLRMLEDGFAFARSYGDDRKRSDLFWDAASRALEQNLGMWAACPEFRGED